MTNIALFVAVACTLVLVAQFVRQSQAPNSKAWVSWAGILFGGTGAFLAYNAEPLGPWKLPLAGLLTGLAVTMALLDFPDSDSRAALGAPLGLAAVLLGVFAIESKANPLFALGILAGAGATAAVLALQQRSRSAGVFSAVALAGLCTIALGGSISPTEGVQTVVNIIAVALLALVLGEGLGVLTKKTKLGWPPIGTALVFGGLSFFLTMKGSDFPDLPLVVAGSALVAAVLSLITKGIKDSTFAVLVGALVWLGVATAAFSFAKGYGLSLAALVGVCAACLAGERRAVVCCAPILAMATYRFARFSFPDASRAFDIGQHYAIVGLLLGLMVPMMVIEWGRSVSSGKTWATATAAALAGIALLTGTSLAVAFLGAKGASGLVIGYLMSPILASLKGDPPKTALATGLSLAVWAVASIGALAAEEDLARPDKVRMVLTVGGLIALLAVAAWGLTRFKKESIA